MAEWLKWVIGIISAALILVPFVLKISKAFKRILIIVGAVLGIVTAILSLPDSETTQSFPVKCSPAMLLELLRQGLADPKQGPALFDSIANITGCIENSNRHLTYIDSTIVMLARRQYKNILNYFSFSKDQSLNRLQKDSILLIQGTTFACWAEDIEPNSSTDSVRVKWDSAFVYLTQYLAQQPYDAQAWYNRGNVLGHLNRYEEEVQSYDEALKYMPNRSNTWNNRGIALINLGRYEEALTNFKKALTYSSDGWTNVEGIRHNIEATEQLLKELK